MSDFDQAARYAKQCLDIDLAHGDPDRISSSMNTLAGIYMSAHQAGEAEKIILQAIDYAEQAHNPPRKAVLMGMASEIYHSLQQEERALDFARQAHDLDASLGRELHAAIRQDQMSAALIGLQRYDEAEALLRQAIPALRGQGDLHSLAIADNHLGTCLVHLQRHNEAAPCYREAVALLAQMGDAFNEMYAHRGLCLSLWESHPDSARAEMDRFNEMKDSLYTTESIEAFARLNAEFGNDMLSRENERMSNARLRDWLIGIGIVLVLAVAGILLLRRQRRRQRVRVAELMREIERLSNAATAAPAAADTAASTAEQQQPAAAENETATERSDTPAQPDATTSVAEMERNEQDSELLNRVIEIVNANMASGGTSLAFIAGELAMSETTLRRRITALTGDSPKTYIQAIQMQHACRLLAQGVPAGTVALVCGFSDPSSFTRTFKRIFGITPSQWRPLA